MFRIGDKIVLKDNPPPMKFKSENALPIPILIKKKEIKEVKGISFCVNCGNQFLDLGFNLTSELSRCTHVFCCECGNLSPYLYPKIWWRALDFEKVVYNNISAEITKSNPEVKETSDQPIVNPNPKPQRKTVKI